jgi:hypothetical protein
MVTVLAVVLTEPAAMVVQVELLVEYWKDSPARRSLPV